MAIAASATPAAMRLRRRADGGKPCPDDVALSPFDAGRAAVTTVPLREDRRGDRVVDEQDEQRCDHEDRAERDRPTPGREPDRGAACSSEASATAARRSSAVPTAAPSTTAALTSPNPIDAGDTRCSVSTGSAIARAPTATPARSSVSFG